MNPFLKIQSAVALGMLLAGLALPHNAGAQDAAPRSAAKVLSGDVERIGPVTYDVETATSASVTVLYGDVLQLCGDGDGCSLRLTLTSNNNIRNLDAWWFVINANDLWTAKSSGGGATNLGDVSNTTDEVVFQIGSQPGCTFEDATVFDVILRFRFRLTAVADSILPESVLCVLRIDD